MEEVAAVKVRGKVLSPPVALAPMVGLSHSALRSLVQEEGGIGLFYTEMLAIKRLPHDNAAYSPLLIRTEDEHPLFYQILAGGNEYIAAAVDKLEMLEADGIDLNLGCPAPMIRKQGAGASLANNHRVMCEILRTMRKKTELPISVKIRLGKSENSRRLLDFCQLLIDQGVDMITIHARLDGEKFCRKPRWTAVGEIKKDVEVPVFVNGGIFSVEDARRCLEQSGADGLMVGRGAAEKPWLCREIAESIYGLKPADKETNLAEVFFRFIVLLEERFAPERQLGRLKQFASYFAPPLPFGHHLAAAIQTSPTLEVAKNRASKYFGGMKETELRR